MSGVPGGGFPKGSPCARCGEPSHRKGLCREHFNEDSRGRSERKTLRRTNPDGSPVQCKWNLCAKPVRAAGFCGAHYQANAAGGYAVRKPCPIPGCNRLNLYERTAGCKAHSQFASRYSLTIREVARLYEERVCGNTGCANTKRLHLDHDHECCPPGKFGTTRRVSCGHCVRGWLCHGCNIALGLLNESPEKLRGLIDYCRMSPRFTRD